MLKKTVLSALLLGAAVFAASPSQAAPWRHPGFHAHLAIRIPPRFPPLLADRAPQLGRRPLASHVVARPLRLVVGRRRRVLLLQRAGLSVPGRSPRRPTMTTRSMTTRAATTRAAATTQAGPGDQGGGGYGTWYHCSRPEGYYPLRPELQRRMGIRAGPAQRHARRTAGWSRTARRPPTMARRRATSTNNQYNNGDQPPPPPHH